MQTLRLTQRHIQKAWELVTRLGDSVDETSRVKRVSKDDQKGDQRTRKAHFDHGLKQASDQWNNLNSESAQALVTIGVLTTVVYEAVVSTSPAFPCTVVVTAGVALLAQQPSSASATLILESIGGATAVNVLIFGNLGALTLYLCSVTEILLRVTAAFPLVLLSIFVTQTIVKRSAEDHFGKLIANLVESPLEQRAPEDSLMSELLEHLVGPDDAQQGCALLHLRDQPSKAVDIKYQSQRFLTSIQLSGFDRHFLTKPGQFLTNLVCKEVVLPKTKGSKQSIFVEHLIRFGKSHSSPDTKLNLMLEVTGSSQNDASQNQTVDNISMEIIKMAKPGLFLLKTNKSGKKLENMPNLRKILRFRRQTTFESVEKQPDLISETKKNTLRVNSFKFLTQQTSSMPDLIADDQGQINNTVDMDFGENAAVDKEEPAAECVHPKTLFEEPTVAVKAERLITTGGEALIEVQQEPPEEADQVMINTAGFDHETQILPDSRSKQIGQISSGRVQMKTSQVRLRHLTEQSQSRTENEVHVYQIIHDLRHPIDAQRAKTEEIRKAVQKKYRQLKNSFVTAAASSQELLDDNSVQGQFALLDRILTRYCVDNQIQDLSLDDQFTRCQNLLQESDSSKKKKQRVQNDEDDQETFAEANIYQRRVPKLKEQGYLALPKGEGLSLKRNEGRLSGKVPMPPPQQFLSNPTLKENSYFQKGQNQLRSFSFGQNPSKDDLLSSSIPDKQNLEPNPHKKEPVVSQRENHEMLDRDIAIEELKVSSSEACSSESGYSVGSADEGESTIQECNESLLIHQSLESFKRGFGERRDLNSFCSDNDITIPKKPFIKTSSHFGSSLTQERLFIESKVAERAKFDILSHKGRHEESSQKKESQNIIGPSSTKFHSDMD